MRSNRYDARCRSLVLSALIVAIPTLSACKETNNSSDLIELGITAYNYTNRSISQFSVNGAGGGNVHVSGPNGGGGGTVCCAAFAKGTTNVKVTVRWQTGSCTYNHRTSGGESFADRHSFFKEEEIPVDPNIPANPNYLEVHFYPDGHVEAAITETASRPRLILSKDREDRSRSKSCPGGKKPITE